MKIDQPRIRLELELPAERIQHHLEVHNDTIEKEVKEGVEEAIETLSKDGYLKDRIKEKVISTFQNDFASQIWKWNIRDELKEKFRGRLDEHMENYMDELTEEITKSLQNE